MRRRGLAIPLAAGFCVIMGILISATVFVRNSVSRQQKADWQGLKAHFVAQGAIQMALYKFRVLPNEGFDASEAAKGGDPAPLNEFLSDVGTESIAFQTTAQGTWENGIVEGRALNAVSAESTDVSDDNLWKHVVTLRAQGRVTDGYLGTDRQPETRIEELRKTVEVKKIR